MATNAERLTAAREAYDALVMGKAVAELRDQNGETITYTKANLTMLRGLIKELEAIVEPETTRPLGPMRFY